MEIYGIVEHELLPLVKSMPELQKEMVKRMNASHPRMDSFMFLNRFLKEESFRLMYINNEGYFPALQSDMNSVCLELFNFIETLDNPMIEKLNTEDLELNKTKVLYRGEGVYEYKNKQYQQKNWNYAKLSDFVYARCRLVGSKVSILEAFNYMRPERDYMVDNRKNWKWIFDTVVAANRWAKQHKLPKLMDCEKDFIVRLGISAHQPKRADKE